MDLLILFKIFLLLGSVCYLLTIISFFRRHKPKVKIVESKSDKGDKENGRNIEK